MRNTTTVAVVADEDFRFAGRCRVDVFALKIITVPRAATVLGGVAPSLRSGIAVSESSGFSRHILAFLGYHSRNRIKCEFGVNFSLQNALLGSGNIKQ